MLYTKLNSFMGHCCGDLDGNALLLTHESDLQLVVQFGKFLEPFRSGASLEKVCHWEWALSLDSLDLLPLRSLSTNGLGVTSQPLFPPAPTLSLPLCSCNDGLCPPGNTGPKPLLFS